MIKPKTFMEEIAQSVNEYCEENKNPTKEEAEEFLKAAGLIDNDMQEAFKERYEPVKKGKPMIKLVTKKFIIWWTLFFVFVVPLLQGFMTGFYKGIGLL